MKHLIILFSFYSSLLISQKSNIRTSFFDKNEHEAHFAIKEIHINNPSGGNDSTLYQVKLSKVNDTIGICKIEEITAHILTYDKNIIINYPIKFSAVNNKIKILNDLYELKIQLKKSCDLKYGKDSVSLDRYYQWLYNPKIFIESIYLDKLNIIGDFFESPQNNSEKIIIIPNMSDSMPAKKTKTILLNKENIIIETTIKTDSTEAKRYIFRKEIEKQGESIKQIFTEKDMIYIPTIITSNISGKKSQTNIYTIQNIKYEKRINTGNKMDRISIIHFERIVN